MSLIYKRIQSASKDITEQVRLQQALAASEREFRALAENSPDLIYRYDRNFRRLYVNSAVSKLLGKPIDALIGSTPADGMLLVSEQSSKLMAAIQQVFASGETGHLDIDHIAIDSRHHNYQMLLVPEYDVGEKVVTVLGIARDITAIRDVERRLTKFVANFPGFAFTFRLSPDGHGSFPFASPGIEQFYGLKPEDVKNDMTPIHALTHPEDRPRIKAALAESARTMTPFHEEIRICRSGLPERWIEMRSVPMADTNGNIVWYGLMIDIDERKRTETERQQLLDVLAQSADFIGSGNLDRTVRYLNQAALRMLGLAEDTNVSGMRIADTHPAWAYRILEETAFPTLLEKNFWRGEGALLHRDGHEIPVSQLIMLHRDGEGKPLFISAIMTDITERKRTEDALKFLAQRGWQEDGEPFLTGLARYLGTMLRMDYVIIDKLADDTTTAETVAIYAKGNTLPNMQYTLKSTPCENVMSGNLCCYPSNVQQSFPDDTLLINMQVESYAGIPLWDSAGKVIGLIAVMDGKPMQDSAAVTSLLKLSATRVAAELESEQAKQALAKREREFRTLVENLPTYVVRLDRELHHVYANPAYLAAAGLPEAKILGAHVSSVFWRTENVSAQAYIALLMRVLRSGVQEALTMEWTNCLGQLHSDLIRVAPELAANGEVSGLLVQGFDITAQRREQRLETLRQRVFETMAHGGDLNIILEQVAQYVESSKPDLRCSILLLDKKRNCLVSAAAPSFSVSCTAGLDGIALCAEGMGCSTAAYRGEQIIMQNMHHHASPENCRTFARETGVAACWSEPIIASSGEILGIVNIYSDQAGKPENQDLTLLRHASQLSSIPIERQHIEDRMHHQAGHDSLTGLPNRRLLGHLLREDISKAERRGNNLALFFIDLDHFKEVNDTLGHENGDLLLIEAAGRIRACVRESDTVARLGGDEFVVILSPVENIARLGLLAQSILDAMIRPFALGEHTAYVSASIGIAGYPLDAKTAESLIGCADQAMYVAKEQGRSNFNFFTPAMQQQVQARLQLGNDLRDALSKGQLQVHYQPIVDIATGQIVKAEALLRWKHPHRGMVLPDKFIPIAEANGLIHEIGDWVFRQAVSVAQCWNISSQHPRQISVNLSPRQFIKGNIDTTWLEHLQQLSFNPAHIVVEITEGLLLDDHPDILETLARFCKAGMQVALDDFGTGYSAMAYLKKFPIDYLKIDRSFVRDLETNPNDRAIAEAIVVMAHKLDIKVIAEGVETPGQNELLTAVGCEYIQGFLHAKPMPTDEFLAYVATREFQAAD
jgi:diguanylate cyclase (GGDEF)-like protein/PAS domain S-box-containing protein